MKLGLANVAYLSAALPLFALGVLSAAASLRPETDSAPEQLNQALRDEARL
jgi:hypothetical protein